MFLLLVICLWIEKAVTDACFCFWWFVCGLRKQPADKFRVAAAARLKLFNQSSRGPDLIFKTQSGSDRKKMFDWFKPNQAKPNPIGTWSNLLKPDHLKYQPIKLTQTNMIMSGFAIRATFYEKEMQIKGNIWLIEVRANRDNIGRHKEFDILVQTFGNTEKFGGDICIGSNLSNLDKCFSRGWENL